MSSVGRCVCSCDVGEYIPDGKVCQRCDGLCRSCSITANRCTSCNSLSPYPYFFQIGWTCLAKCPGTYFASEKGECQLCSSNCMSCRGSATNCTSCSPTEAFKSILSSNGTCVGVCSSNEVAIDRACVRCRPPCSECAIRSDFCIACLSGASFKGKCYVSCPTATYLQNGRCEDCMANCLECSSASSCNRAFPPYLVSVVGQITMSCGIGEYVFEGWACRKCSFNCAACFRTADQCTQCKPGFLLSVGSGTCTN